MSSNQAFKEALVNDTHIVQLDETPKNGSQIQ